MPQDPGWPTKTSHRKKRIPFFKLFTECFKQGHIFLSDQKQQLPNKVDKNANTELRNSSLEKKSGSPNASEDDPTQQFSSGADGNTNQTKYGDPKQQFSRGSSILTRLHVLLASLSMDSLLATGSTMSLAHTSLPQDTHLPLSAGVSGLERGGLQLVVGGSPRHMLTVPQCQADAQLVSAKVWRLS